ncbi:uncharacterized protein LOC110753121 [Prunus avium]|uniref:Uncharacterized protein LOC110753121 n=1 Tax=Prunus avium TaxID=42229 RepID=A0A6P5S762_PRUAV|nr:uncharacterized protein LOC110753121 [Prunus avium]
MERVIRITFVCGSNGKCIICFQALQQQSRASDDFQEIASGAKELSQRKFSMDAALEDKICDLYDLFVDGLDEDAGPQIRKLYAELAGLWPNGFMDNHGIKRAICRSKERRREHQVLI